MTDAFGRPYDLDQSGRGFHKSRSYLGPSLGWVETQILPERKFNAGGGTHQINPGDQVILTEIGLPITFLLPDSKAWEAQVATMPATGFTRGLMFKDYGGNARDVHVTIVPFDSQTIDGLNQSIILSQDFETLTLFPLVDGTGWYAVISTFDTGTGGTTSINPTAPIIGNVVGDVINVGMQFDPDIFRVFGGQLALDVVSPGQILGNPTVGTNPPIPTSLSAIMDRAIGSTQGSLVFRGNASWEALVPGSNGQALLSGGAGSNPFWSFVGAGNVISSGTPVNGQLAQWTDATHIRGINVGAGLQISGTTLLIPTNGIVSGMITGGSITTIKIADNQIINSHILGATIDLLTKTAPQGSFPNQLYGTHNSGATTLITLGTGLSLNAGFLQLVYSTPGGVQAYDDDLQALSGLTGTNTIYYRGGVGVWVPVAIGANMSFAGGVLSSSGGGAGDVTQAGNNNFTGTNTFMGGTVFGHTALTFGAATYKVQTINAAVSHQQWSADSTGPVHNFLKAAGPIGTFGAVLANDALGTIQFNGADGSSQQVVAQVRAFVEANFTGTSASARLEFWTRPGVAALARRMGVFSDGTVSISGLTQPFTPLGSLLNIEGTTGAMSGIALSNYQASAGSSTLSFRHSRGALGAFGALLSGDGLAQMNFYGSTASAFVLGAQLLIGTEAAPIAGGVQSGFRFSTYDGSGIAERVRIWSSGGFTLAPTINTVDPGFANGRANKWEAPIISVKQGVDGSSHGIQFANAAADAAANMYIAGTSSPNSPRDIVITTNFPGTGLKVFYTGDFVNPAASFTYANGCTLKGTVTNDSAAVGYIGEYKESNVQPFAVTSGVQAVATSLSLTAGDWDVCAHANGSAGIELGITTGTTLSGTVVDYINSNSSSAALPLVRISLSATTTVNLVERTPWTGNLNVSLKARRRR